MPLAPPPPPGAGTPDDRSWAAARIGVGLAGFCAFLSVYATQPLLPLLERVFGVSKAEAALTVSAPTIAVAIAAPFAGALAARLGHRRVIVASLFALAVPTLLAATSTSVPALVAWRFAQGLVVPGAYAVAVAYIAEVWPARGLGRAMSALVTGNVIGGFTGRVLSGLAVRWGGWRASFVLLGVLTAVGAFAASRALPRARAPQRRPAASPAGLRLDLLVTEPRLLATCAVGFNVLFTLVATFTYVTFYLAGPPFRLGATALSWIFVVYLVGALVTPFAGRWIDRVGSRRAISTALGAAVVGGALTLAHAVWWIELGLAATCTAAFVSQAASTAFLRTAAPEDARSAASGLYVSCYYLGGAAGGVLPAAAWRVGGWPACVALVAAVQVATIALAWRFWRPARRAEVEAPALAA
ncbi:MFS transporter [Anaeromyxobacter oryzae]|uniref:MFS transporter n=1 Tax=Anaeromyxobacter oryzae TaxID=2918170 RepID=A0ABN6MNK0_9BACT|nr:MFS transporter [Anaeromyxobacter oryzae]BDG01885.1 MFS transporter [Anaeromyxobacter oryzae]